MNHSCTPKVYHCWNAGTGQLTVHATRDLRANDEIWTFCVNVCFYQEVRQKELDHYGLRCDCSVCCMQTDFGRMSEQRRRRLCALNREVTIFSLPRRRNTTSGIYYQWCTATCCRTVTTVDKLSHIPKKWPRKCPIWEPPVQSSQATSRTKTSRDLSGRWRDTLECLCWASSILRGRLMQTSTANARKLLAMWNCPTSRDTGLATQEPAQDDRPPQITDIAIEIRYSIIASRSSRLIERHWLTRSLGVKTIETLFEEVSKFTSKPEIQRIMFKLNLSQADSEYTIDFYLKAWHPVHRFQIGPVTSWLGIYNSKRCITVHSKGWKTRSILSKKMITVHLRGRIMILWYQNHCRAHRLRLIPDGAKMDRCLMKYYWDEEINFEIDAFFESWCLISYEWFTPQRHRSISTGNMTFHNVWTTEAHPPSFPLQGYLELEWTHPLCFPRGLLGVWVSLEHQIRSRPHWRWVEFLMNLEIYTSFHVSLR